MREHFLVVSQTIGRIPNSPYFFMREAERNDADGHNRSYDVSVGRTLVRRLFM
jgi:hypothetical protein